MVKSFSTIAKQVSKNMGQCIQPMHLQGDTSPNANELDWTNDSLVGRKSAQNSVHNTKIRLDRSLIWSRSVSKQSDRAQPSFLLEGSPNRRSITFAEDLEETILIAADAAVDSDSETHNSAAAFQCPEYPLTAQSRRLEQYR